MIYLGGPREELSGFSQTVVAGIDVRGVAVDCVSQLYGA